VAAARTGESAAKLLSKDEARKIVPKLPGVPRRQVAVTAHNRMAAVDCFFQEDKMSESELVRDLVHEGIRQAMQLEALNIRS
jgi:hypothetical protein